MGEIELIYGDITTLEVDSIVNAANSSLSGGGGVDGAIHKAAGSQLDEECKRIIREIGKLPTGEAVITTAGNMKCKFVIHTVGPIWKGGQFNEAQLLANAYWNSLTVAVKNGIKTIAFPNISTGVYGYPKEEAAKIAIDTVKKFISENRQLDKVVFVCFDKENYKIYKSILENVL